MPKESLIFRIIYAQHNLSIKRNIGKIYCDDQMVNVIDFKRLIDSLSKYFGVSKTILGNRLLTIA